MFLFTYRSPSVYPLLVDTDPPVIYRYTYAAAEEPLDTEGSDMTKTDTNIESSEWVDIHGRTVHVQAVEMSDGQWKHYVLWHKEQGDGSVICESHPTALTLSWPVASQLPNVVFTSIAEAGGTYDA